VKKTGTITVKLTVSTLDCEFAFFKAGAALYRPHIAAIHRRLG